MTAPRRHHIVRLPPGAVREHGFLFCRVCHRSVAFFGIDDPETWPKHRCGWNINVFHRFTLDDPNHVGIPDWKAS